MPHDYDFYSQITRFEAQTFYWAFECLMEERTNEHFLLMFGPAIVCVAFSVELGLKALLLREGKKIRGHNLEELFEALNPATQTRIRTATGLTDADYFALLLRENKEVFEKWRYVYERVEGRSASSEFLSDMAKAILAELYGTSNAF